MDDRFSNLCLDSSYMTKQEQKEQKELIKKLEEEIKDYYPIY